MIRQSKLAGLCVMGFLLIAGPCRAGSVVSDGSLGAGAVVHQGNTFTIPRSAGRLVGGNLFQSLLTLNLDTGETANFTGPAQVSNVLTRVTGGQSTINGTLQCSIPNANFYLINPAGVVFGPDANLNVGGSFAVTTADVIHLADGGKFKADVAANSVLTTAAPAAFGFLHSNPGSITVNGGAITTDDSGTTHLHPSLNPAPTGSLMVVGGNITINGGELATPGTGAALIVSVGSPGTVNLSNPTDASSFSSMGTVKVRNGGMLGSDASSSGGVDSGPVTVVAGNVTVNGTDTTNVVRSHLGSFSGTGVAGSVIITASGAITVEGGGGVYSDADDVYSATDRGTDSGFVSISAASATVSGIDTSGTSVSRIASLSGTGAAGPVTVTLTDSLVVSGGAKLASDASTSHMGTESGPVTISAGSVTVSGTDLSGNFVSRLGSFSGTAFAGSVTVVTTGPVIVNGGAELASDASNVFKSNSSGTDSASVTVFAGSMTVAGTDSADNNFSRLGSFSGIGKAGAVTVTTKNELIVTGGAELGSDATNPFQSNFTGTDSGSVTVSAGSIMVVGADNAAALDSLIGSFSGSGNAGRVRVTVTSTGALTVAGGSELGSDAIDRMSTVIAGVNSNSVTVSAGSVSVSGADSSGTDSFLGSSAGTGRAGRVIVTAANALTIQGGAEVASDATSINAKQSGTSSGAVSIFAENVIIKGADSSGANSELGSITGTGDAGPLNLTAQTLSIRNGGLIVGETTGSGAGGFINVNTSGSITLDGAGSPNLTGIEANSLDASTGKGGDIMLSAGVLTITNGASISADASGMGTGGVVTVMTGSLALDGSGQSNFFTGISSSSFGTGPNGGSGGNVNVSTGMLTIKNHADIDADTSGTGAAGNVKVVAGTLLMGSATDSPDFTGIGSRSFLKTSGGGPGGTVTIQAENLSIQNGAKIDASTFGDGGGGSINVIVSGPLTLDGSASPNHFTGIVAQSILSTASGGNGGDVNVSAATLAVLNGASISASTFGAGLGGNCRVTVSGALTMDGRSSITAESRLQTPGGGSCGDITLSAGTISLTNTAFVSADTFGSGQGGKIKVAANSLSISTGSDVEVSTLGVGTAGDVIVTVDGSIQLDGGESGASSGTGIFARSKLQEASNAGKGGDITLNSRDLVLLNGAEITAASLGSGVAGKIDIATSNQITLESGSLLTVSSVSGDSGDLTVVAGGDIFAFDSSITTEAGNNGGSITLMSPGVILLRNTPVTARAQNNGGNITIDPILVILDHSSLTADAVNGTGGAIKITTSNGLLQSNSPITASSTFGLQGTVTLTTPPLDVAAGLVTLPQAFFGGQIQLAPTCAQMTTGDISSFILTGHGGLPIEPGGWLPILNLLPIPSVDQVPTMIPK
jgi:filamentous hemagglutinin family protein